MQSLVVQKALSASIQFCTLGAASLALSSRSKLPAANMGSVAGRGRRDICMRSYYPTARHAHANTSKSCDGLVETPDTEEAKGQLSRDNRQMLSLHGKPGVQK